MPVNRMPDAFMDEAAELVRKHGNISAAARAKGIPRKTMAGRYSAACARAGVVPVVKPRIRVQAVTAPYVPPADPIDLRRARDAAAVLRHRVAELEGHVVTLQDAYTLATRLSAAKIEPATWQAAPSVSSGTTLTPVLFSSDFQCGEVIDPAELDGMNSYDKDIFAQRYALMIDKTVDIAKHHTGASSFPGAIYCRGGDAISGGIHPELAETDDLASVPAVRYVLKCEREGIRRLASEFGRVHVISIPGNHGRNTFKPRAKGYVTHNYETLLAWWLQESFAGDGRVTFDTPKSGDAYFDVMGWKFLMSHGDRMGSRGGSGFIGPAATIARGHKKLYDTWTQSGQRVDRILTGHLHTSLKLELGYANGSLAGYSEYARDLRCYPDAAKQWLLFVHRDHCVSHAFELQLSAPPRRVVSDAWAA